MGLRERLDSRAQLAYSTLSIHRCGSSISAGNGSVSGPDQIVLKRSIPTRSTTWSTNALPRVYWLSLASRPSSARSSRCSGGCLRWRRSSNRRADGGHRRHHHRPDGVHHVVGVAFQQGAQHQQLIQGFALRLGLHGAHQAENPRRVGVGRSRRRGCGRSRRAGSTTCPMSSPASWVTSPSACDM